MAAHVVRDTELVVQTAGGRVEAGDLPTVARIVEAPSGRAGAEESPTGGTTVWFELPARS